MPVPYGRLTNTLRLMMINRVLVYDLIFFLNANISLAINLLLFEVLGAENSNYHLLFYLQLHKNQILEVFDHYLTIVSSI